MSLLQIIQDATDLLGLPKPDQVIGNSDPTVQTLLAVANTEGEDLARRGPWQQLEVLAEFTTVDQQTLYNIETVAPGWNAQRNPTMWDNTQQNLVNGPLTPAEMQTNKAYLPMNVYFEWRIAADKLEIYPPPSGGLEFTFEYITRYWCKSDGGTLQERWKEDTDVGQIPEFLMRLGIEWRYNQRVGLDSKWPEQKRIYDSMVVSEINSGVQGRPLDLAGRDLWRQRRVPWGSWPEYM